MITATLLKIAKELFASAKTSSFLKPELQQFILQGKYSIIPSKDKDGNDIVIPQNAIWQNLNDQQKQAVMSTIQSFMTQIDKFILQKMSKQFGVKNVDKNFVRYIDQNLKACGKLIFNVVDQDWLFNLAQDYNKFKQFLEQNEQNYLNFKSFQDMADAVERYKKLQKVQQDKLSAGQLMQNEGSWRIYKFTDFKALYLFSSQTRWCVQRQYYFKYYGSEYYLVLKNWKVHSLINFAGTTPQNKNVTDVAVKASDIDSTLAKLQIDLMKKQYHKGDTKLAFSYDFQQLFPYYPTQYLIEGLQKGKISSQYLKPIIMKSVNDGKINELVKVLKQNNVSGFDIMQLINYVSTDNQYKQVMLNIFPKNADQVNEQQHLKKNVKLSKDEVSKLLFNAFKQGDKGQGLFKRMLKFSPGSQINSYTQGDVDNTELLSVVDNNNNGLIRYASKLNQLKMLDGFGIKANDDDYKIIFSNVCNNKSVDLKIIEWLTTTNKIALDKDTLYAVMKSKKDAIISYFLEKTTLDFNQVMYENMTPLFYVIKQEMDRIFDMFLKSSKINSEQEVNGRDLLYWAIQSTNSSLTDKLCKTIKSINKIYISGKLSGLNVLSYAIKNKSQNIIDAVFENPNLDVNILSPIDICILKKDKSNCDKIINHHSFKDDSTDNEGNSPIIFAIKHDDGTYEFFKKIFAKTNITKSSLTNTSGSTKMTPLMVAIDYNMPCDMIKQYFGKKGVSFYNQKDSFNSIVTLINNKLQGNPNDSNMLQIKQWVNQQNKVKDVKKKNQLELQLLKIAQRRRMEEFEDFLNNNIGQFDFTKSLNGMNILEYLTKLDSLLPFVAKLIDFMEVNNKQDLNTILTQRKKGKTLYQRTLSPKIKTYLENIYEQHNIKTASRNSRIAKFIIKYLN